MKGNANLSTIKATYFPTSIPAPFMGAHPPIKNGQGSLFENGNVSYFQNYRNENLCKFQMPPYEWGQMSTKYSPKPDLVAANKINLDRTNTFKNSVDITLIDQVRQGEVDNFYQACQYHRDQYRDHTGSLHPLDFFRTTDFAYQCPPELTRNYLKYPTYYTTYKVPPVLPRTLERSARMPNLPERTLRGRYMKYCDFSFKR